MEAPKCISQMWSLVGLTVFTKEWVKQSVLSLVGNHSYHTSRSNSCLILLISPTLEGARKDWNRNAFLAVFDAIDLAFPLEGGKAYLIQPKRTHPWTSRRYIGFWLYGAHKMVSFDMYELFHEKSFLIQGTTLSAFEGQKLTKSKMKSNIIYWKTEATRRLLPLYFAPSGLVSASASVREKRYVH